LRDSEARISAYFSTGMHKLVLGPMDTSQTRGRSTEESYQGLFHILVPHALDEGIRNGGDNGIHERSYRDFLRGMSDYRSEMDPNTCTIK
jgi:hypothetical protein